MTKILLIMATLISTSSCKPRKEPIANSDVKAFETYKVNPNEPATQNHKTSCSPGNFPQTCSLWLYYHPKIGNRTDITKKFDSNQVAFDPLYINQSGKISFQTFPSTCSLQACVDTAGAYFKSGYLKSDGMTYTPIAVQYEYNDGFADDSDGVICLNSLSESIEKLIENKAGKHCTDKISKP